MLVMASTSQQRRAVSWC